MQLIASKAIQDKILSEHDVMMIEAEEAFNNFAGYPLQDSRAKNRTKPETMWFLAETYDGRLLKVVYIPYPDQNLAVLRTAYEPDNDEVDLWNTNQ